MTNVVIGAGSGMGIEVARKLAPRGRLIAADVNLEACSGCGVSAWGWQDNGYGTGVLGPLVYFAVSGPQTLRIQTREDGFSIDQIVLSPAAFLSASPGAPKNDTCILAATQ